MSIPDEVPCREARKEMRELYELAHRMFMDKDEVFIDSFELLSYDLTDLIKELSWGIGPMGMTIAGDLMESINLIHRWYRCLIDLSIWTEVLNEFSDEARWRIRDKYVEQLAYYSILQPSAARDRFGTIATTALHQANVSLRENYKDSLEQDNKGFLSRRHREQQLNKLGSHYPFFMNFKTALRGIDDKDFSQKVFNFRNLSSHGIAPNFEMGEVSLCKRWIGPSENLVEQACGGYQLVSDPSKKSVYYGFGGTGPISFEKVYDACWVQFERTVQVHHAYEALLKELITHLHQRPAFDLKTSSAPKETST
jgi:hypothetical protein